MITCEVTSWCTDCCAIGFKVFRIASCIPRVFVSFHFPQSIRCSLRGCFQGSMQSCVHGRKPYSGLSNCELSGQEDASRKAPMLACLSALFADRPRAKMVPALEEAVLQHFVQRDLQGACSLIALDVFCIAFLRTVVSFCQ